MDFLTLKIKVAQDPESGQFFCPLTPGELTPVYNYTGTAAWWEVKDHTPGSPEIKGQPFQGDVLRKGLTA